MDVYTAWDDVPDNFKTKTQLAKDGLRLAKDQKNIAIFKSIYYKKRYALYSVEEAIPKRKPSAKQLAVLEQNRIKARTCQLCGKLFDRPLKICWQCKHHLEHDVPVIQWARVLLEYEDTLFLDTETTGLNSCAEIVEIAIVDRQGDVLIDTLVKPTTLIPKEVQLIHGITNEMVANAPSFREVAREICLLLVNKPVIIYNADFDMRMLKQSAKKHGLWLFHTHTERRAWNKNFKFYSDFQPFEPFAAHCAMLQFAEFYGEWNGYYHDWRWQKLEIAVDYFGIKLPDYLQLHRALGDTIATLQIVKALAQQKIRKPKS